jgi:putative membrane protein
MSPLLNKYGLLFLKGIGMGAANVIPGVSGGTIALVTGIYEDLINSLKSFNLKAIQLLLKFEFKDFSAHVNLSFLIAVFTGVAVSIVSLAKLLEFFFDANELLVWSFFFGLILASIYYVGSLVKSWNIQNVFSLLLGVTIAVGIAFLEPASENTATWYLLVCGVVAVSSMILPGLSGSYVLILLGNYQLIMLTSVSDPLNHIHVLIPVFIGAVIGFLALSHGIAFVLKRFYDATISLLTGFVIGSLLVIWPWKEPAEIIIGRNGEEKVVSYNWLFPDFTDWDNGYAFLMILLGVFIVWGIEKLGSSLSSKSNNS